MIRQTLYYLGIRKNPWKSGDALRSQQFRDLIGSAGYFVFTSSAENCPIVLLEAMAAGPAIVTTNATGCAEAVGGAAMLVPSGMRPLSERCWDH